MLDEYDKETGTIHIAPKGLEHHEQRKRTGTWIANIPINHYIIVKHQELFPELKTKMDTHHNPTGVYSAFITMLPFQLKGKLTDELKLQILKMYGVN